MSFADVILGSAPLPGLPSPVVAIFMRSNSGWLFGGDCRENILSNDAVAAGAHRLEIEFYAVESDRRCARMPLAGQIGERIIAR
jgi:hypothetical protein